MSVENVKKFYEEVSKDEALKQKFVELSKKYQGQQMDEDKAMAITEQEMLPLAKQMGYSFTMDDLKVYGEEMKQANMNCELSEEEMQAVTGGIAAMICVGAGWNPGRSDACCCMIGVGQSNDGNWKTCFVVGVVF